MKFTTTDGERIDLQRHHFIGRWIDKNTWEPPYWLGLTLSWLLLVWLPVGLFVGVLVLLNLFVLALIG